MKTKTISDQELSAYLDRELDPTSADRLERRLEASPEARRRLEELREVVEELREVERVPPPAELHQQIARRLALEREPTGVAKKLSERRDRYLTLQPIVWTLLAVILALALFILLMSGVFGGSRVVVIEEGPEVHSLSGGDFVLEGSSWRQLGVVGPPARSVAADTAEGQALLEARPWLSELAGRAPQATSVLFELEGETVELVLRPETETE